MRLVALASLLMAGTASAQSVDPREVFPRKVDGIEYRTRYGREIPPGWADGLTYSMRTWFECQRRLTGLSPAVCMVRKAPDFTS